MSSDTSTPMTSRNLVRISQAGYREGIAVHGDRDVHSSASRIAGSRHQTEDANAGATSAIRPLSARISLVVAATTTPVTFEGLRLVAPAFHP